MNADEPSPRAQHAPGTTFHHLGRTADGRQVFVPVPPGADAEPILAAARAGHEGTPEGSTERVVEFAQPGRVIRLEDIKPAPWANPTRPLIDVGQLEIRGERKLEPIRGKSPARNAPCPCGSGRKHKRCCRRIV